MRPAQLRTGETIICCVEIARSFAASMNDDSLVDLFFSPGGILETTNDMLSDPLTKSRSLIEGLLQSSNGAVGSPSAAQMSDSQYRALLAAAQELKKEYDDEEDPAQRKKSKILYKF